jgi:hypothetical protein
MDSITRFRVSKSETLGVEVISEVSRKRGGFGRGNAARRIQGIAHEGKAGVCQMNTDLVRPSGHNRDLYQRGFSATFEQANSTVSLFTPLVDSVNLIQKAMGYGADGRLDIELLAPRATLHESPVDSEYFAFLPRRGQEGARESGSGEQGDSGCTASQAVKRGSVRITFLHEMEEGVEQKAASGQHG